MKRQFVHGRPLQSVGFKPALPKKGGKGSFIRFILSFDYVVEKITELIFASYVRIGKVLLRTLHFIRNSMRLKDDDFLL